MSNIPQQFKGFTQCARTEVPSFGWGDWTAGSSYFGSLLLRANRPLWISVAPKYEQLIDILGDSFFDPFMSFEADIAYLQELYQLLHDPKVPIHNLVSKLIFVSSGLPVLHATVTFMLLTVAQKCNL